MTPYLHIDFFPAFTGEAVADEGLEGDGLAGDLAGDGLAGDLAGDGLAGDLAGDVLEGDLVFGFFREASTASSSLEWGLFLDEDGC